MPYYNFLNQETDESFSKQFSYDEMEEFLKNNPNIVRDYSGYGGIGDSVRLGVTKTPEAWKDILRNVKRKNRNVSAGGTNINIR